MQWLIGTCSCCGKDVVRRYSGNAQDCSTRLTGKCKCSPPLELMRRYIKDGSLLVVWNEKKK